MRGVGSLLELERDMGSGLDSVLELEGRRELGSLLSRGKKRAPGPLL